MCWWCDRGHFKLDVVKKILGGMEREETSIEFVKDRPGHDRRYAIDWTKINRELGWKPQYGFDVWLEKTITWYQANQEWWKRIKTGAYQSYYDKQYGGSRE